MFSWFKRQKPCPTDTKWHNYHAEYSPLIQKIGSEMREKQPGSYEALKWTNSDTFMGLKKRTPEERCKLCDWLVTDISASNDCETALLDSFDGGTNFSKFRAESERYASYTRVAALCFNGLMRRSQDISVDLMIAWFDRIGEGSETPWRLRLHSWPCNHMVQQLERRIKKHPLNQTQIEYLRTLANRLSVRTEIPLDQDFTKVQTRLELLVATATNDDFDERPYKKLSGDNFGDTLEAELSALSARDAKNWNLIFNHAFSAKGSSPKRAFEEYSDSLREQLGAQTLHTLLQKFLQCALDTQVWVKVDRPEVEGKIYDYSVHTYLTKSNMNLVKGLVWMSAGFQDAPTIRLIADLCEKCMKKLPRQGPAAHAVANACLWYLETTPGPEALVRLSRLSTVIKQISVQERVENILAEKAAEAGLSTLQLEERIVPDFGLERGTKIIEFDDYTLKIVVEGPRTITHSWIKADGTLQKTKPAAIAKNADLQERYNKAKKEIAELKKIMIAQRDRIDRLFAEGLSWKLHEVETHYIHHGLVGAIGGKLIWLIGTENGQTSAVYVAGHWQDVQGNPIVTDPESPTQLWHPVAQPVDAIFAWRSRLAALNIIQPTKQAHREIYLLTDAERASKVYSNRMAAHIVKQHQVATLMAGRGWRYSLMGAYDDGIDSQFASKTFSTSDLRAEYFIRALFSEEEQWNEAGIYLYVGTDQLRFVDDNDELVPLETVPIRLFSEVMREADLFVGVASVGNDPVWFDQGPTPEANTYWHGFSFGELDKLAQTRREVLQELLPRLKIKDVAHIEGKFLIVDGKLNTYKIHLGSSNILMVPGDRYLCIVPGSRTKTAASANIALPFEGDTRLSVILSKALMLAEDDKIKDEGILSQLKAE